MTTYRTYERTREMTVGELIELLSDYPDDREVRLAVQPAWAFEYAITSVGSNYSGHEDEADDADCYSENPEVVYIGQGTQLGYLPDDVDREAIGWTTSDLAEVN